MVEFQPSVENEFDGHKTELQEMISTAEKLTVPNTHKNVVARFVRDCQTLISDLDAEDTPSAADLSDYDNRKNSMEIQYHNLTEDIA